MSGTGSPGSDPSRRSFRRRLTLAFVLVGAATGAVLVLASFLTISTYRHRSFVRDARREAELSLLPGPARFSPGRLDQLLLEYRQRGGFESVVVTPERTLASSPPSRSPLSPRASLATVSGGGLAQAETTVGGRSYLLLGGTPAPGVQVFFFFSQADLHRGVKDFAVVLLLGWAVAVAASAAFGNLVARRALRPVRAAADASQALAAGLLETRLTPASDDEFGQWADAFNRMVDALAAKIAALSESQERERRFTSDVAHELRNPLAAMVSAAGILGEELDTLPATARPAAALLVKDVSRLSQLVQELLELARLDAGQESVHLERLRVADALAAVLRAWDGSAPDQAIAVDVEPGLEVTADRARFRRVVTNLVSNALRHGGGDVAIRARRAGATTVIEVTDRGPGIRPESLERIFDRFHKEDTARSRTGSGLGLAIALQHARAQGGELKAANRAGGGARFTFTLPGAAPSAPTTGPAWARRPRPEQGRHRKTLRLRIEQPPEPHRQPPDEVPAGDLEDPASPGPRGPAGSPAARSGPTIPAPTAARRRRAVPAVPAPAGAPSPGSPAEDGVGLLLDVLHDGRVPQGGGVTQRLPFGDVLEQPAHDLAGARLRQVGGEDHRLGAGDLADLRPHPLPQLAGQLVRGLEALSQQHEAQRPHSLETSRVRVKTKPARAVCKFSTPLRDRW